MGISKREQVAKDFAALYKNDFNEKCRMATYYNLIYGLYGECQADNGHSSTLNGRVNGRVKVSISADNSTSGEAIIFRFDLV